MGISFPSRSVPNRKRFNYSQVSVQMLVDACPDAMLIATEAGEIVITNMRAEKLFGYSRKGLVGRPVDSLIPPRFRDKHATDRLSYFAGSHFQPAGRGLKLFALRVDGTEIPVDVNLSHFINRTGTFILAVFREAAQALLVKTSKKSKTLVYETYENDQQFRLIADFAPVLIWMSGTDKLCSYFNKSWLDFTGRSLDQVRGNGWTQGVHPDDIQACLDTRAEAFNQRDEFRMEYRLRRHDGEYRWVFDVGVPRFDRDQAFAGYIGSCVDMTERKLAEETLSKVGGRLIEAHEEERAWIARELHDDISQRLALLANDLEMIEQTSTDSGAQVRNQIHEQLARVLDIAAGVRAISHRLHSSKLRYLGIVAAARSFCQETSEQYNVEIKFIHRDIPSAVPEDISLCVFRVLQEGLHNAVKHSGIRHFEVQLRGEMSEITLTIRDAGVGFNPEEKIGQNGIGLISMRERIALVGGSIAVTSSPRQGTEIIIRVPLPSKVRMARGAG